MPIPLGSVPSGQGLIVNDLVKEVFIGPKGGMFIIKENDEPRYVADKQHLFRPLHVLDALAPQHGQRRRRPQPLDPAVHSEAAQPVGNGFVARLMRAALDAERDARAAGAAIPADQVAARAHREAAGHDPEAGQDPGEVEHWLGRVSTIVTALVSRIQQLRDSNAQLHRDTEAANSRAAAAEVRATRVEHELAVAVAGRQHGVRARAEGEGQGHVQGQLAADGHDHAPAARAQQDYDRAVRLPECAICFERKVEVVLVPCGHTMCGACADRQLHRLNPHRVCPFDRRPVDKKVVFYM